MIRKEFRGDVIEACQRSGMSNGAAAKAMTLLDIIASKKAGAEAFVDEQLAWAQSGTPGKAPTVAKSPVAAK